MNPPLTPFPISSHCGALWLQKHKVQADLIYIDAAHDYFSVYQDIQDYWELVRSGGVMFGDDYNDHWPDLKRAVNCFAGTYECSLEIKDGFWILRKDR